MRNWILITKIIWDFAIRLMKVSNKNFGEALECYKKLLEKDFSNPDYQFKKGSTERELKDRDIEAKLEYLAMMGDVEL